MTSERKLAANQKNAKNSTGPKSDVGKHRSAQNALSHGLSIPIGRIADMRADIEVVALSIARASGEKSITELSRQAAEAQLEILRIRKARVALFEMEISGDELTKKLASLERYERRAYSRRKSAFRSMQE
jgi:hypothetical protein